MRQKHIMGLNYGIKEEFPLDYLGLRVCSPEQKKKTDPTLRVFYYI